MARKMVRMNLSDAVVLASLEVEKGHRHSLIHSKAYGVLDVCEKEGETMVITPTTPEQIPALAAIPSIEEVDGN